MFYSTHRIVSAWWWIRWKRIFHTCAQFDKKEQNHQQQQPTGINSKISQSGKKRSAHAEKRYFSFVKLMFIRHIAYIPGPFSCFAIFTKIYRFFIVSHIFHISYSVFTFRHICVPPPSPILPLALMYTISECRFNWAKSFLTLEMRLFV